MENTFIGKTVIEQAGSNGMALLAEVEQLKKDKSEYEKDLQEAVAFFVKQDLFENLRAETVILKLKSLIERIKG